MNSKLIKPLLFTILVVVLTVYSVIANASSFSKDYFYGVDITSIYDGDTFSIETEIWPQHFIRTNIRMYGIDTPEMTWRGKCQKEKDLGLAAREFLVKFIDNASYNKIPMTITRISHDKYNKRFVAKLFVGNKDVSKMMIDSGHAVEYYGKGTKKDWCL